MRAFRAVLAVLVLAGMASGASAATSSLSAEANAAYLADNAKKPRVVIRPSGLQYTIVHNGYGKRPLPTDMVTVYYTGSLINGTVFDGTEASLPRQFKVTDLIPGWTEALELMREGDQWHIIVPPNLAYGSRGAGGGTIPPNQTLVFDLTLITVTTPKEDPDKKPDTSTGNQPD
ncbi:MAG TPA: FKBP-type peptidyl-prolyl cis-trans isomerase [Rhizomicrobium sp.]|nr:FKBP-type peptidyl-prolyl cis-trans isomerase [Rhizomicrobium sp.]